MTILIKKINLVKKQIRELDIFLTQYGLHHLQGHGHDI